MKLRAFNEAGVAKFAEFLTRMSEGQEHGAVGDLLENPQLADRVGDIETPDGPFLTKLDFAQAAVGFLVGQGIDARLEADRRLWMWLTARYLDCLLTNPDGGRRRLLELKRYAPEGLPGRPYSLDKNLLYLPWKLLHLHGAAAHWLLMGPLGADTKVTREMANTFRRNIHTGYVELAGRLYFDANKGMIRKGATAEKSPGNLRDLDRTLTRLDLTYDIFGMGAEDLLNMLPQGRFGRWIKKARGES